MEYIALKTIRQIDGDGNKHDTPAGEVLPAAIAEDPDMLRQLLEAEVIEPKDKPADKPAAKPAAKPEAKAEAAPEPEEKPAKPRRTRRTKAKED